LLGTHYQLVKDVYIKSSAQHMPPKQPTQRAVRQSYSINK
jgi:hypothetical protein